MRYLIATAKVVGLIVLSVSLAVVIESLRPNHWYVKPAPNGKWYACLTEYDWFLVSDGCGSPISYDEALWWVETKGGTKFK